MIEHYCSSCHEMSMLSEEELEVFKENSLFNNNELLKCPYCITEPISAVIRIEIPRSDNGMSWSGISGFYANTNSCDIIVEPRTKE